MSCVTYFYYSVLTIELELSCAVLCLSEQKLSSTLKLSLYSSSVLPNVFSRGGAVHKILGLVGYISQFWGHGVRFGTEVGKAGNDKWL